MNLENYTSIFDLAVTLDEESGFNALTAEESWNWHSYMTPMQRQQHAAACSLYTLAEFMRERELEAAEIAAYKEADEDDYLADLAADDYVGSGGDVW